MALPPEPLSELLAAADAVILASVVELVARGPKPARPETAKKLVKPGATSVGIKSPTQRVRLKVERVLKGQAPALVEVDKPEAGYVLRLGDAGPFFLKGGSIIGRYGPDTHRLAAIEKALRG